MSVSIRWKMIITQRGEKSTLFKFLITSNKVRRDKVTSGRGILHQVWGWTWWALRWIPSRIPPPQYWLRGPSVHSRRCFGTKWACGTQVRKLEDKHPNESPHYVQTYSGSKVHEANGSVPRSMGALPTCPALKAIWTTSCPCSWLQPQCHLPPAHFVSGECVHLREAIHPRFQRQVLCCHLREKCENFPEVLIKWGFYI